MQGVLAPRRFWQTSLIYFLGNILSKLALFFMLPLYTAYIPLSDMGVYDATTAIAVLVSSFLFLDIGVGIMRFYLDRGSEGEGGTVLVDGLFLIAASSVIYLLLGGILLSVFEIAHAPLVLLYGLCNALFLACGLVVRAQGYATWYAAVGVISTLLQIACNLVLILCLRFDYAALYLSYIVGAGVGFLLLLARCPLRKLLRGVKLDFGVMRRLVRFCLPLGVGSVAYWGLTSLGRVLVTLLVSEEAGGVFAVSLKFSQVIVFASLCFRLAWQELAFAKGYSADEGAVEQGKYYHEKTDLFVRVALACCLVAIPLSRVGLWLFPDFIAPAYLQAKHLIPAALMGGTMTVLCDFLEPMFGVVKKTGYLLLSTVLGAILNVLFAVLFISLGGGALGVHLAFLLAAFFTVLLRLWLLRGMIGLRLRLRYLAVLPLVLLVVWAYGAFSAALNICVLAASLLLALILLFPECRLLYQKIKKAKA